MKLSPREAPGYFARPDPRRPGLLIYGADAMRVALRRQEVVAALVGPEAEAEMRLTRIPGAELRRQPSLLVDAVKAIGFFPGPRAAVVEEATDAARDAFAAALEDWREGDAVIVATAGNLSKSSGLRKLFEGHPAAYAAAIYDEPPSRAEVESLLAAERLATSADGMAAVLALAQALDPGDFRQTLGKLALYKLGDARPVSPADLAAVAPATVETDVDAVLNVVAEAKAAEIGPLMRRIEAQGVGAVALAIAATRHFRLLLTAAADPGGPSAGIARLRPPVFGPRRDRLQRQATAWGRVRLEQALALLLDTDLTLRSASKAPTMAVMERALIRLAMLGRER